MSLKRELVHQALVQGNFQARQFALRNFCGWTTHGEARPQQDIEVFEAEEQRAPVAEHHRNLQKKMEVSYAAWKAVFGEVKQAERSADDDRSEQRQDQLLGSFLSSLL